MYLTFDEYTEMGGTLDEAAFNDLSFEAESVVNWWTFNRLQKETEIPVVVKKCVFKLVNLINDQQKAMILDTQSSTTVQANIASESNDGVSTSYNTLSAKEAVDTIEHKLKTIVNQYLQGVRDSLGHKLLYRGIYPNE